jgi:hypothetical protein
MAPGWSQEAATMGLSGLAVTKGTFDASLTMEATFAASSAARTILMTFSVRRPLKPL